MPHAPDLSGCALDDRYELHAVIGEGAFGRVYRGLDRRLERPIAVKMIKPWWAEDPEWAQSFEREAQLLARVSDPGIVQIFDVGHAAEGLYYVSELVEGESLAHRLRRGPLARWEAASVAEQLCRALAQAHARRVVHRDVKPANILISADGRVKVGDFGVARLAEGSSDGANATLVGTPRYMAPEQARGRRTSPATDVYSAGVVLYEMLAGRPPFSERSAIELALRHLSERPGPLPAGVPAPLVAIVERALAKDPADRYANGGEMADALAAAAEAPVPTLRAPALTPRRNLNPAARRRSIAALALVFLLLGTMIVAALAIGATGHVRLPRLLAMTRAQADTSARRLTLAPSFSSRYDRAAKGTVIGQRPGPGKRVPEGATVRLVLSAGPPPVKVPQLAGKSAADAQAALQRIGLRARVAQIAAPGVPAGTVTSQSPAPGSELAASRSVALDVARTPHWQPLTSLAGGDQATAVQFRVRGTRWRIVYTMGYRGTCTFIFFCSGPGAQVDNLETGAAVSGFGLSDGGRQTRVFDAGSGEYRLRISPGSDTARWSMWVEDYY
ncbi:MAG: protein kinase domain-containing protein [Solirubrobacteraceae bacterium]